MWPTPSPRPLCAGALDRLSRHIGNGVLPRGPLGAVRSPAVLALFTDGEFHRSCAVLPLSSRVSNPRREVPTLDRGRGGALSFVRGTSTPEKPVPTGVSIARPAGGGSHPLSGIGFILPYQSRVEVPAGGDQPPLIARVDETRAPRLPPSAGFTLWSAFGLAFDYPEPTGGTSVLRDRGRASLALSNHLGPPAAALVPLAPLYGFTPAG